MDEIVLGIPLEEIYSTVLSNPVILLGMAEINIAEIDTLEKNLKRFDIFIFKKGIFHSFTIRKFRFFS